MEDIKSSEKLPSKLWGLASGVLKFIEEAEKNHIKAKNEELGRVHINGSRGFSS